MLHRTLAFFVGLSLVLPALAAPAGAGDSPVTLEQIMADSDWIGNPPEGAYWGYDSKTIYYHQKRDASRLRDLYAVDVTSGAVHQLADPEVATAPVAGGVDNLSRSLHAFLRDNNVFVRDLTSGSLRQLTRDTTAKTQLEFMADGKRLQWHQGDDIYIYDLGTGLVSLAANVVLGDDPAKQQTPQNYLQAEQLRLFDFLNRSRTDKQAQHDQQTSQAAADATHMPAPWYLGNKLKVVYSVLSPDGHKLALVTQSKDYDDGAPGMMPNYITESGYAEIKKEHSYVGLNPPPAQQVKILDLDSHASFDLDETQLPGVKDDPLASLRKTAVEWDVQHGMSKSAAEDSTKAPAVRELSVNDLSWSDDGAGLAILFDSNDNKDRWLASVDFMKKSLVTQNRITDNAWINSFAFADFGWTHDGKSLWYLSEVSGYSQLYLKELAAKQPRALTQGSFEVAHPQLTRDDAYFYVESNKPAPGTWEIYRVDVKSGAFDAVTALGGLNGAQPALHERESYALSPDESKLLVYHSGSIHPPEVYLVDARPNGAARQLTHTVSSAFSTVNWVAPQIVQVPSSHVPQPIYARLYVPKDYSPTKTWPAVVFIHGAGYLQDAHSGWSYYYHELMFHTFLTQHGYLVLDMDYRGSAGYGRDWRTTIYRQMGHPEVEDITDGARWLEQNWHADAKKLGVYGGSYGGFMTYMMMFRQPDLFAAGAALRPVGDWADYNDGYTSAILNRANVDPKAYFDSSPINYAGELKNHLLIMQGMEDDNVFFIDTVHMVQKLIELRNPNFDVMFYPVEHHDFHDPASWLDEYRRIWRQFNTYVDPPPAD